MHILALNPFHGGSHKAFLDGWVANSNRHDWTCLTLPDRHWKWRMRHGAFTFAQQLREQPPERPVDLIFTTDMMDVAALRGLLPASYRDVPILCYFHENQLTYPWQDERERDHHFAYTNIQSALAADAVWFNSKFHRDDFFDAAEAFLRRMPDFAPVEHLKHVRENASVQYPGVWTADEFRPPCENDSRLHVVWAARWEHDKNPEAFFDALRILKSESVPFTISVVGQQFERTPSCFSEAQHEFASEICHWGFLRKDEYLALLLKADCIVSTAIHEFFGIAVVEAMSAGCVPVLPNRLSYPELIWNDPQHFDRCLYDGTVEDLARKLTNLAKLRREESDEFGTLVKQTRIRPSKFDWWRRAVIMDARVYNFVTDHQSRSRANH